MKQRETSVFLCYRGNVPPWRTHPEHHHLKEPPTMFAALISALAATSDFTTRALITFANTWTWG